MLTTDLALVSEISRHDPFYLSRVVARLHRQPTRDFEPVWNVNATVDPIDRREADEEPKEDA